MKIEEYECFLLTSLVQAQMPKYELFLKKNKHFKQAHRIYTETITLTYFSDSSYLHVSCWRENKVPCTKVITIPLGSFVKFGGYATTSTTTYPFIEEKFSPIVEKIFNDVKNGLCLVPGFIPIQNLIEDWLVCVDWNKLELDSSKLLELTKARYES